jgi:hypothetical protein
MSQIFGSLFPVASIVTVGIVKKLKARDKQSVQLYKTN